MASCTICHENMSCAVHGSAKLAHTAVAAGAHQDSRKRRETLEQGHLAHVGMPQGEAVIDALPGMLCQGKCAGAGS